MRCRALLTATVVVAAARADATVVLALSLDDLLERSEVVCLVRVEETRARRWRGTVVTDVRGVCERAVKGASEGATVRWFTLGGVLEGFGARIPGEPVFRDGDRAIVFLSRAAGGLRVTGMSQGALFVRGPPGSEWVGPAGVGAMLVREGDRRSAASWLPAPRPLVEVLDGLEAHLDATR